MDSQRLNKPTALSPKVPPTPSEYRDMIGSLPEIMLAVLTLDAKKLTLKNTKPGNGKIHMNQYDKMEMAELVAKTCAVKFILVGNCLIFLASLFSLTQRYLECYEIESEHLCHVTALTILAALLVLQISVNVHEHYSPKSDMIGGQLFYVSRNTNRTKPKQVVLYIEGADIDDIYAKRKEDFLRYVATAGPIPIFSIIITCLLCFAYRYFTSHPESRSIERFSFAIIFLTVSFGPWLFLPADYTWRKYT